ncbi:MAG: hypothetical protein LWX54_08800 [Deltaproteobacteria bacterium]|nr:hypothetical protein [Deltaproteobacteria bacterium]
MSRGKNDPKSHAWYQVPGYSILSGRAMRWLCHFACIESRADLIIISLAPEQNHRQVLYFAGVRDILVNRDIPNIEFRTGNVEL